MQCTNHWHARARVSLCLRHSAQQHYRHPARTTFHGYPRDQSGEFLHPVRLRLPVRPALPRLAQEDDEPGWVSSSESLCRLPDQTRAQDPRCLDALIVKEWPNIQRILASLAQKDVTQATIVRKLSSYARQNQTKKALWELDHIRQTIHILDFIDDLELRQSVQKALNRGEAYHRMRRA